MDLEIDLKDFYDSSFRECKALIIETSEREPSFSICNLNDYSNIELQTPPVDGEHIELGSIL